MRKSHAVVLATVLAVTALPARSALVGDVAASSENVERVGGDQGRPGGHVVVEGNRLYVGSDGLGLRIYDISDPATPRFLGEYTPALGGDARPRTDAVPDAAVFGNRHLAVVNGTGRVPGLTPVTEFLDVTNPAVPIVLHTFAGPDDGEAHNGDIVDERALWVPSGGGGNDGLRIYDMRPLLASPPSAPEATFGGNPVTLWRSSPHRKGRPVGEEFTHTHDVSVYPNYEMVVDGQRVRRDILLLAEGGQYAEDAGDTGSIFVIDVTNPTQPVVLNRWLHHRGEGHHPIRYHHEAQFLDGDPRVMLVTDEDLHNGCGSAGGIVALRVSDDLESATELSEWFIPEGTPAPSCSVHVFSSSGSLVFLGSFNAGLQVVDYADAARPRQVGHYIAPGTVAWGAQHHRGYVYVGDTARGLDVFRYTGPQPANPASPVPLPSPVTTTVGGVIP
ncbi:MAG: hypothetical protein M3Q48_08420 [Actinomycetota bacterium]|nr:hypothetical protein [Actinomycetota bacterium]